MANKKNKKKQRLFSLTWKFWLGFIIVQLCYLTVCSNAVYSEWPCNDRNTQTVIGEVENIRDVSTGFRIYRGHGSKGYLEITVNGQPYRLYVQSNQKEMSTSDVKDNLAIGDSVEIAYKAQIRMFKECSVVVGMKDDTQTYRTIEAYNANARVLLPVFSVLMLVAEALLCLPLYAEYLLRLIVLVRTRKTECEKKKK